MLGRILLLSVEVLEAFYECGNLKLFPDFPVDEIAYVGVIQVKADHLGGAAGGTAGLDRSCGSITNFQE